MKNRLKALFLAAGLTVGMFGTLAYGEETTESVTEAVTEAGAQEAEEAVSEVESELADDAAQSEETEASGTSADYYESMEASIVQTLQTLSTMTDEQLQEIIDNSTNTAEVAMAANWNTVKDELGNFGGVTSQEVTEDGTTITVTSTANYDGVDEDTVVDVVYELDLSAGTATLDWNIDYPLSTMLKQAAMNTVMGLGVVFVVLIFLTFLIGQLHWIPDLFNRKEKEKEAAKAAAPISVAPAPAPVVEEEENLTDDLELVAVITAAIAASEQTSTDGFVVRSIKKANRRKWLNAQ